MRGSAPHVQIFFVPKAKAQIAILDMQTEKICYVKDTYYLPEDRKFAVTVHFKPDSDFRALARSWAEKWESVEIDELELKT